MMEQMTRRTTAALALVAAALGAPPSTVAAAQAAAPQTAVQADAQRLAPIDLVGTWVSVVTEDWQNRMLTPKRGDFEGLPLTDDAKKIAGAWTPPRDAREACAAYAAPTVMRIPERVKISWQSGGAALQIQTDAGQQTRLLHFGGTPQRGPASWQGYSVANWEYGKGFDPRMPPAANTRQDAQARAAGGTLKVVTTNLKAGYLRKNGAPFSDQATVTEYFEIQPDPRGTPWFVVTTFVSDPKFLLRDYVTSTNFKKEADDSKWHPTACSLE
jgi:hypothetical protein